MSQAQSRKTYRVTTIGPINIGGVLKRKDDPVSLTDVEARSYAAHIKKYRGKSKRETKTETKDQEQTK